MIDLHSHIAYGIDDGPADLEGALALARAAVAAGTTTIAATPHIDTHFGLRIADREAPLAAVRRGIAEEGIALEVVGGAEIALDRYLELDDAELGRMRLGDGEFLLLECPLSPAVGAFDHFLATLLARGVRMLLAHPERCPDFQRHPERLAALVRAGALGQVTAASLAGRFGRTVQAAALHMLERRLIHDVASDAHDTEHRGPDLRTGLEAAERRLPGAHALADWLTLGVPGAIIAGAPIPSRPAVRFAPRPRRRLFGRR